MPRTISVFTGRRLLAVGMAAAAVIAVSPSLAIAAPARTLPSSAVSLLGVDFEQKVAVAVKFGLGDNSALVGMADDRDFVIEFWKLIKGDPNHQEVRAAAELAFGVDAAACSEFILTGVYAAFDRDVERERREAEEKRIRDAARAAAASAVNIVAGPDLINATDAGFATLIRNRVKDEVDKRGNKKWPKVVAAAEAALSGGEEQQREFIATSLAAAAKEDIADGIAGDEEWDAAQKAEALARAAKQFAANRIGLPVTEQLLKLPYRDFIVEVWNHEADDTQVQIAAIKAARSLNEADWKAFVDTGIHQAKDRDIQIALDKKAAEERRLVEEILARAEAAAQYNLPQAARKALAGTPNDIADFYYEGQYKVPADLPDALRDNVRFGRMTGVADKCVDIANSQTQDGTRVQLTGCNGNDAQDMTSPGDGTMRLYGKCVDAGGAVIGAGQRLVHLWTCNGTAAQKWQQRPNGSFLNELTTFCLDVQGNQNGAQLYVHPCNGGDLQKWKLPAAGSAAFGKLVGVAGKCLDIPNARNTQGTPVQLWTCNTSYAQHITEPGDNTLRLAGKCVDAGGALVPGGTGQRLVHLWPCNNTAAQKWLHNSNDSTLYNELTKFCLDVPAVKDGTQMYVHPCNAGTNQRWKLSPVG
jgi:hypothetical protein